MIDKKLFGLLGNHKKYLYYIVILMTVGLLANITVTAFICKAIKLALHYEEYSAGPWIFLTPAAGMMLGIIIRYLTSCLAGDMKDILGRKVKKELRHKIYDKIIGLGTNAAADMSMAGMTQVAIEGVEQLDLYYSNYIPQFFYSLLAPVILFLVTVWIDVRTSVVLLLCVPLIPISIAAVSRYAKKIFAKYWGKYTSMGDSFLDSVQGMKELKIFQADGRQQEKMKENSEEFRRITMKVLVMQLASTTVMDLVAYLGAGIGIALAVDGVVRRGLSPVEALFLILVAVDFFLPLRAFGSAFHVAMNGASAGNKILALLEEKEPKWGEKEVQDTGFFMENVSFSYDGNRQILTNITMEFKKSGMVSIVGHSGCGKSTIVGLLTGSIEPSCGTVLVGGKDRREVSRESFYSHVAVVSYNTYLFNETVWENFKLAKKDITEEEIHRALKKVNLHDFIMKNGGLHKVITEDGTNLSGGQKQRLALAINLAAEKAVYIFDEATSNIDAESEAIIMENIRELACKKSVIVISHRLENVVSSDVIYYMEEGKIIEKGTHRELRNKKGGYDALYRTQKQLEEGYREV